jgi:hypothetical protein
VYGSSASDSRQIAQYCGMRHSFLVIAVIFMVGGIFGVLYLRRPVVEPPVEVPYIPPPSTPTPLPTPSVKEVGEDRWKVTLVSSKWFNTRIPVIANQRVTIENTIEGGKWIGRVGQAKFFSSEQSNPASLLFAVRSDTGNFWNVEADYQATLLLTIDDEGTATELILYVGIADAVVEDLGAGLTPEQSEQRVESEKWAAGLKRKLAR